MKILKFKLKIVAFEESKNKQDVAKYVHEQKETNVLNIKEEVVCGSGCGSVGWLVVSNIRGPWFESSQQKKILNIHCQLKRKIKNKKGNWMARY